jgi:hypothetical protein
MDFTQRLERTANLQALKYLVSKQMFCPYTDEILDYRRAIMIEINKDGNGSSRAISLKFKDKLDDIKKSFEAKGYDVKIFINEKKK